MGNLSRSTRGCLPVLPPVLSLRPPSTQWRCVSCRGVHVYLIVFVQNMCGNVRVQVCVSVSVFVCVCVCVCEGDLRTFM